MSYRGQHYPIYTTEVNISQYVLQRSTLANMPHRGENTSCLRSDGTFPPSMVVVGILGVTVADPVVVTITPPPPEVDVEEGELVPVT